MRLKPAVGRTRSGFRAAAAGEIVYTGSGLMGYGQLVIIKHNEAYLSAYGHNDTLLVAEGQAVERGQAIARERLSPARLSAVVRQRLGRCWLPPSPAPATAAPEPAPRG